MYTRVKRVTRGEKVYEYVQLVEGHRVDGKVRQRVVATLGRLDELKASGQLDRLAGSFARLDPPPVGTRREVGPLLVVRDYVRRLGIADIVDRAVPMRGKALLTHGEVVEALVVNRLCAPAPLYDVAGWASSAAVAELLDTPAGLLNDDRLGRALDALAPVAEHVRGAAALAALDTFDVDISQLHVDLTKLRFAGAYPDSVLVEKGWGPDRTVARQVQALQAVTDQGVPIYVRPHPGAAGEVTAMGQAMDRLRQLLGPGIVVVADSALGRLGNLCAADRAGVKFVVPLRADTGFVDHFVDHVGHHALRPLRYVSQRQQHLPADRRTRYRGTLVDWDIIDPATQTPARLRVAFIHSSEEQASVADARQRALEESRNGPDQDPQRPGWPLLPHPRPGRHQGRHHPPPQDRAAAQGHHRHRPGRQADHRLDPRPHRHHRRCGHRRDLRPGNQPGRRRPACRARATTLQTAADRRTAQPRRQNDPQGPSGLSAQRRPHRRTHLHRRTRTTHLRTHRSRPAPRHRTRHPPARPAPRTTCRPPTGTNILAAFDHLAVTYTPTGLILDRLTPTQRTILALLDIPLPWPERQDPDPKRCGKRD
jgi:hypothetical protein